MQRSFAVLTLFGASLFATAGDSYAGNTQISQTSNGDQTGINSYSIDGANILNGDFNRSKSPAVVTGIPYEPATERSVDQSILNAANILLSKQTSIQSARQVMVGTQGAENIISTGNTEYHAVTAQIGENLANIVMAFEVNEISQAFGPGATQSVYNELSGTAAGLIDVTQVGRNTANIVEATLSIGTGEQLFPSGTTQTIHNVVSLDHAGTSARPINQSGTNIGNVLVADEVRNVMRVFSGDQIVRNSVTSEDGNTPSGITQSGVNIANFVSARHASGLKQISDGRQLVVNEVEGMTLEEINRNAAGNTFSSSNIVNLLEIQSLDKPETGSAITASQRANQTQTVDVNQGVHSQVGNAASISR
ncbi:hypothetical protein [Sulfitobacter sp. PS-8MA]|uniref:hypothetical protein n=1 Tax=Sulfitobacter sp. PS-8MA TaxID=3237707 RepID=UPI0034C634F3